jgi:hypothetical protein
MGTRSLRARLAPVVTSATVLRDALRQPHEVAVKARAYRARARARAAPAVREGPRKVKGTAAAG